MGGAAYLVECRSIGIRAFVAVDIAVVHFKVIHCNIQVYNLFAVCVQDIGAALADHGRAVVDIPRVEDYVAVVQFLDNVGVAPDCYAVHQLEGGYVDDIQLVVVAVVAALVRDVAAGNVELATNGGYAFGMELAKLANACKGVLCFVESHHGHRVVAGYIDIVIVCGHIAWILEIDFYGVARLRLLFFRLARGEKNGCCCQREG